MAFRLENLYDVTTTDRSLLNYDQSAHTLNRQPTHWMNFGLWDSKEVSTTPASSVFSEACERLTKLVGATAKVNENDTCLDLGFGCGDQILVWLETFNAKHVTGVEINKSQYDIAVTKLQTNGLADRCTLLLQSVEELAFSDASFLCVLSVDSAYHFHREAFHTEAYRVLKKGGRLAMTDFVFQSQSDQSYISLLLLRLCCWAFSIPFDNVISENEYRDQLKRVNFQDITITDVSDSVFPGFYDFVGSHERMLVDAGTHSGFAFIPFKLVSAMLYYASLYHVVRLVCIGANKR